MSFAKNIRVMLFGFAMAQAIPLLASPLLTRLYAPDAFGLQTLFTSWAAALAVIATLRLDLATVLAEDEAEAAELVGFVFLQVTILMAVLILLAALFAPLLARMSGHPGQVGWVWGLLPMAVAVAFFQMSSGLLAWAKRFGRVSQAQVLNQLSYLAVAVGIGLTASSVQGLAIAKLAGQLVAAAALLLVLRSLKLPISLPRFSRLPHLWRRFHPFVLFNTPYSLIGVVGREVPVFAFSVISATASAGFYGLARTMLGAPAMLLAASLSQVFYREAAEHQGTEHLKTLTAMLLGVSTRASAPLFALIAVWGDVIFSMVFGADWANAGLYAMILSFAAWLGIQTSWPERLFEVAGRQGVSFAIQLSFDCLGALAVTATILSEAPNVAVVVVFAIINSLFHTGYLIGMFAVSGFSLAALARIMVAGVGLFLLSCAAFLGLRMLPAPPLAMAVLSALLASFVALYFLVRRFRTIIDLTGSSVPS